MTFICPGVPEQAVVPPLSARFGRFDPVTTAEAAKAAGSDAQSQTGVPVTRVDPGCSFDAITFDRHRHGASSLLRDSVVRRPLDLVHK